MSVIQDRYLAKYDVPFLLGQVLPNRLVNVYGSLCVNVPTVQISHSVIYISRHPLRSIWLACKLQHMLT